MLKMCDFSSKVRKIIISFKLEQKLLYDKIYDLYMTNKKWFGIFKSQE